MSQQPTPTEAYLRELVLMVATEYACSISDVELSYGCLDGEWGWSCIVREKYKKHGAGRRLVRGKSVSWGDAVDDAVAAALGRAAGYRA